MDAPNSQMLLKFHTVDLEAKKVMEENDKITQLLV